ncbi:MAG: thioredoxin domain-containing protein [Planctomycetes bacterium]|nr:thioredoxin domain-containing protein [Planctomycetota bacterium]
MGTQGESQVERPQNGLKNATSPYLLQHQYNPVDWHEWGPEALALAKRQNKPIFLSIGYSACHWCHVMERESFEDEETAALMNRCFVCIKVDREERPDIDATYMAAVQRMTGSGGWPLSVWLTPDLQPFYGGTYFPPLRRGNSPSFRDVLNYVHSYWIDHAAAAADFGQQLIDEMHRRSNSSGAEEMPGRELLAAALRLSGQYYDPTHGGFARPPGFAPKFPHCTELTYLLRLGTVPGNERASEIVQQTLREMAAGGIYDQIGGGFARYSTDREWTVPHFEKMLYDNAQLAQVYLEAWQATKDPDFQRVSQEILDYVLREMVGPEGGFWSTTDADSEGVEGKFFVWSKDEFTEVCGEDAGWACDWFGVTQDGNFEGRNILTRRQDPAAFAARLRKSPEEFRAAVDILRSKLYARRESRVHPHKDDKILASWNGLMLSAFARAAAVWDEPRYLAAARSNADFLLTKMLDENGRLLRTRRLGHSHIPGLLEDYAFVGQGLLDLYEADGDLRWLRAALQLQGVCDSVFVDEERGGYWSFPEDHGELPVRIASASESALPSDVGVACMNAARLGMLAGDTASIDRARRGLARYRPQMENYPTGFCQMLILLDWLTSRPLEIYLAGEPTDEHYLAELRRLRTQYPPYRVVAAYEDSKLEALQALIPAAEGKTTRRGRPTIYRCREGVCDAPVVLE